MNGGEKMKTIIDGIKKEISKKKIDWKRVEKYVMSLGEQINSYNEEDEETILSEIYSSHYQPGCVNERLTDLFIKHGFDVAANDGNNGASCLNALCWSSYDKYILHIAEKLLDVGADSTIPCDESDEDDTHKGVLDSIAWKFGYWNTGEYDSANMFVAYYEMVYRQQKGKKYQGIRAFRDAVGDVVEKVEKLEVLNHKNEVRTSYLLRCGRHQLVANDYVEFIVNPYARDEAISVVDVSYEFRKIIGAHVRGLRYFNSSLAKLSFDNGCALLVGYNDSAGISEPGAWVKIATSEQAKLPNVGTPITSIKLWGSIRHAETSTFYSEATVVLCTPDCVYGLYSHSIKYGEARIRVENLEAALVVGLHRSLNVHNAILRHVEYANDTIKWIEIACDEGILYVVTNHFTEIALFMSTHEIENEEVLHIGSYTKGLEKIEFVG